MRRASGASPRVATYLYRRRSVLSLKHSWSLTLVASFLPSQSPQPDEKPKPAKGQTLAAFRKYAAAKIQGAGAKQLEAFAKAVDSNHDGVISEAEFDFRMSAFRRLFPDGVPAADPAGKPAGKPAKERVAKPESAALELPAAVSPAILLITADSLAASWLAFAKWKTRLGRRTKVVTISQIAKGLQGGRYPREDPAVRA